MVVAGAAAAGAAAGVVAGASVAAAAAAAGDEEILVAAAAAAAGVAIAGAIENGAGAARAVVGVGHGHARPLVVVGVVPVLAIGRTPVAPRHCAAKVVRVSSRLGSQQSGKQKQTVERVAIAVQMPPSTQSQARRR